MAAKKKAARRRTDGLACYEQAPRAEEPPYFCQGKLCPGLPWKPAADAPHPVSCMFPLKEDDPE